jgi:hypothetical protein
VWKENGIFIAELFVRKLDLKLLFEQFARWWWKYKDCACMKGGGK